MPHRTRVPTTADVVPAPERLDPAAVPADSSPVPARTSRRRHPATPPATSEAPGSCEPTQEKHSAKPGNASGTAPPSSLDGLSPDELARALRAMAVELERDPTLGHRISEAMREDSAPLPASRSDPHSPSRRASTRATATHTPDLDPSEHAPPKPPTRTFRPRVVEGAPLDLGTGIPDPFALRERLGEAGLRRALDELRLGTLRAIVREHQLDPGGTAVRGNDAARLRALILDRTLGRPPAQ